MPSEAEGSEHKQRKLSLSANNTIVYVENPRETVGEFTEIRVQFSEATGMVVNEPKTAVFLSTESKQVENIISDKRYFSSVTDY